MKCAKKLGLAKGKTLIFNRENDSDILFDYILYNHRPKGKNTVDRYLESFPPPPFSAEMTVLRGMVDSRYSLFLVEKVIKGKGVEFLSLLRRDNMVMMDKSLGESPIEGVIFAGRVIPLRGYYMSSGALLPMDPDILENDIFPVIEKLTAKAENPEMVVLTKSQAASLSAKIIRLILKSEVMEKMAYVEE